MSTETQPQEAVPGESGTQEPEHAEAWPEESAPQDAGPEPAAPKRRFPGKPKLKSRRSRWIALGVAGAVLLGGGMSLGTTLPDPKSSEAYVALAAAKKSVESDRDTSLSKYGSLKTQYDALSAGIAGRESAVSAREAAVTTAEQTVKDAEAAVKKREDAVTGAEKTKAANTVTDGTWVVGTDIEPGTYRASADVGSSCYWGIYKSGTNGGTIIENDLPGGGRPSVALAPGQDFKSSRCGSWEKQ